MIAEVKEALTSLEVDGELTAQVVLDAARSDKSPLHAYFEWDDTVAAEQHRLDQARGLIRSYRVEFIGSDQVPKNVRGYISVQKPMAEGGGKVYKRTEEVLTNSVLREQALENLRHELNSLRRKYSFLTEYASVLLAEAREAQDLVS